jgi:cytochrome bd ubiquinol oxidase subunit I
VVYSTLFILFIYLLNKKITNGPVNDSNMEPIDQGGKRDNPLLTH